MQEAGRSQPGQFSKSSEPSAQKPTKAKLGGQNNTVFEDLKLTQVLADELGSVRGQVDGLIEDLEETQIERDLLKKELGSLKNKYLLQKKEFNMLRSQLQL